MGSTCKVPSVKQVLLTGNCLCLCHPVSFKRHEQEQHSAKLRHLFSLTLNPSHLFCQCVSSGILVTLSFEIHLSLPLSPLVCIPKNMFSAFLIMPTGMLTGMDPQGTFAFYISGFDHRTFYLALNMCLYICQRNKFLQYQTYKKIISYLIKQ